MAKITIDDLRSINIANEIFKAREGKENFTEAQTEMDIDMYDSLNIDGTFTVSETEEGVFETAEPWPLLKRRILNSTMAMAQMAKEFRVNGYVCYDFARAHVSTIPDEMLECVQLQFDISDHAEPQPLVFIVGLK